MPKSCPIKAAAANIAYAIDRDTVQSRDYDCDEQHCQLWVYDAGEHKCGLIRVDRKMKGHVTTGHP